MSIAFFDTTKDSETTLFKIILFRAKTSFKNQEHNSNNFNKEVKGTLTLQTI